MRNTIYILLVLFYATACKTQKTETPLTAQVNVLSEDANKTIELRSVGSGSNEESAYYDSEKKAFEILFFRGIPNSAIEQPLIGSNEAVLKTKYAAYFENFFKNKYKSFIMNTYQSSPPQKTKGSVIVVNDIKINIMSLKKDLEDQGLRRKFGF